MNEAAGALPVTVTEVTVGAAADVVALGVAAEEEAPLLLLLHAHAISASAVAHTSASDIRFGGRYQASRRVGPRIRFQTPRPLEHLHAPQ